MTTLIRAENISVIRDGRSILDNVSLNLEQGDFLTIIGPNGAGKTTLLKSLSGLITPEHGSVERRTGLKLGYIPQRMHVEASLPMRVSRFLTLGRNSDHQAAASIARDVGIDHLLHQAVHGLSGGEWQRLLLARALIDRPDGIILDEPAQNLDVSGQLAFYAQLERIHQEQGIAILMVSHDLHMVMASTRRVVCLYHHICCSGEPSLVTRDPEFIRLFGQDMARMMAVYQHQHDHEHGPGCYHDHDTDIPMIHPQEKAS